MEASVHKLEHVFDKPFDFHIDEAVREQFKSIEKAIEEFAIEGVNLFGLRANVWLRTPRKMVLNPLSFCGGQAVGQPRF